MFDDLPVWIVVAWDDDVTDEAVEEKAIEMASKSDTILTIGIKFCRLVEGTRRNSP